MNLTFVVGVFWNWVVGLLHLKHHRACEHDDPPPSEFTFFRTWWSGALRAYVVINVTIENQNNLYGFEHDGRKPHGFEHDARKHDDIRSLSNIMIKDHTFYMPYERQHAFLLRYLFSSKVSSSNREAPGWTIVENVLFNFETWSNKIPETISGTS